MCFPYQIVADVFKLSVELPLELESAALGVALQAAAAHRGVPVAEYIAAAPPAVSDEVTLGRMHDIVVCANSRTPEMLARMVVGFEAGWHFEKPRA